jgi:hypothetical protein
MHDSGQHREKATDCNRHNNFRPSILQGDLSLSQNSVFSIPVLNLQALQGFFVLLGHVVNIVNCPKFLEFLFVSFGMNSTLTLPSEIEIISSSASLS